MRIYSNLIIDSLPIPSVARLNLIEAKVDAVQKSTSSSKKGISTVNYKQDRCSEGFVEISAKLDNVTCMLTTKETIDMVLQDRVWPFNDSVTAKNTILNPIARSKLLAELNGIQPNQPRNYTSYLREV